MKAGRDRRAIGLWLGCVATCALLLCAGASALAAERPWQQQDRLAVNRSGSFRAVVHASRAAGEKQLRALCTKPDFEEIWAFLPHEKLWVELGCCERSDSTGNYIGIETYIYRLFAKHQDLEIYHIHPFTHLVRDNYHADKRLIKTLEEALPSWEDISAMIMLAGKFRAAQPKGRIAWRIVSRHGVTSYGLTPAGLELDKEPDFKRFNYAPFDQEDLAGSPALMKPMSGGPEVDRLVGRAAAKLSGEFIFVTFRPFATPLQGVAQGNN